MAESLLVTVEEAAEALSLSRSQVYDLIAKRELDSVKIGRSRRITREALASYVESLAADTTSRLAST
jgi:excisionase family DNA binding protein